MTDLLASIDDTIADWEAQPEAWNPGDPLHQDPRERDHGDHQVVRPMFQIIADNDWVTPPRCKPCGVTWEGISACWVCGEERPPWGGIFAENYAFMTGLTSVAQSYQVAMASALEQMSQRLDEQLAQIVAADDVPRPPLTMQRLEEEIRRLQRAAPGRARRHTMSQCFVLPAVEDITVPTRAELARGIEMGEVVLGTDLAAGGAMVAALVIRRREPGLTPAPRRLPIDGRAYRRRTLARRRRNR